VGRGALDLAVTAASVAAAEEPDVVGDDLGHAALLARLPKGTRTFGRPSALPFGVALLAV
jgi:hypothetical protein